MTTTRARTNQPLTGWRSDPQHNTNQLTHAVAPGRAVAYCGVQIKVTGGPWPPNGAAEPVNRCSICANAMHQLWSPH
jgi:hypothetical protein